MKYSHKWLIFVALLLDLSMQVSFLTAQTEESSAVNAPISAEVQSDSVKAQPSNDEPEQNQLTLVPDRDTAVDVEAARLYNEFRSKFLDDRAKMVDWWLEATAIFLTLVGVAAAILGYFGFKRLDRIESEAREHMKASEEHAQEAQHYKKEIQRDLKKIRDEAKHYLEETKASRDKSQAIMEEQRAERAENVSYKTDEDGKNGQQKSDSSLIDQAVADAISLRQENKVEEAIEKWRSIASIAEGTDNGLAARAWSSMGHLMYSKSVDSEDFERVVEVYDKAIELNPNLTGAYNNRANAKCELGQYEAAIADYDAAITRNPDHAKVYYNRGVTKFTLGQYEAAIADYDAAITRNPDDAGAYNNRGNIKAELGQYEAAITDYDAAITRNPGYTKAYYNRGLAKVQLQRMDEARQDFEKALNLARAVSDTDLTARAERALENLDRGNSP